MKQPYVSIERARGPSTWLARTPPYRVLLHARSDRIYELRLPEDRRLGLRYVDYSARAVASEASRDLETLPPAQFAQKWGVPLEALESRA